jgi:hypothetical protein
MISTLRLETVVKIGDIETDVRRERNAALSYSTRPKRSLLNEPFRPRGFRFML